jgi:hypothetical protein
MHTDFIVMMSLILTYLFYNVHDFIILYLIFSVIIAGITKMGNSNGDVDCLQQQPVSNKSVIDECSLVLSTSPPPPSVPAAPAVEVRWHHSFCMPAAFSCFKVWCSLLY